MIRPRLSSSWRFVVIAAASLVLWSAQDRALLAQSDLDAFMRQVMDRRDDNWKKLQQYILDEKEEIDIRGPASFPLWGERREFTWFIQDGFFVRSPLKVNGATVSEEDRRKYEANYLRRMKARDRRARAREQAAASADSASSDQAAAAGVVDPVDADQPDDQSSAPADLESFISQTRQPEFVSSAYFLRFKFDEGRYALVGREKLEGLDVLKVEYYPQKLFRDDPDERRRRRERDEAGNGRSSDPRVDDTVNRLMNKGSRVTLWIEPAAHQIIKYTFDNVDMNFFPGQWLVSVTGVHATMTMSRPFPDIWLPRDTVIDASFTVAVGEVRGRYMLAYHDYRQADVSTAIRVPGVR
jgi:hypothetical protein